MFGGIERFVRDNREYGRIHASILQTVSRHYDGIWRATWDAERRRRST